MPWHRNNLSRRVRSHTFIEGLESRQLMSASPVHLSAVTPAKITAGNTGYDTVTIHNTTAETVTEDVTISLAPSLDGSTAAGSYASQGATSTLTLKKHGSAKVKVSFVPDDTLAAGKYYTLATVNIDGQDYTARAPGKYTLIIPPAPTTTPSLIGNFSGSTKGSAGTGEGGTITHEFGFIWQITGQTLNSLTGTFTVGNGSTTGTMTGQENSDGTLTYTLTSADINYTLKGKVSPDGSTITGTIHGTLINNLFKRIDGKFTLSREATV